MKSFKILAASAVTALALTSMAHAATITVYVTGSTAFRGETHRSIISLLGGNEAADPPTISSGGYSHNGTANTRAALLGASRASFQGTVGSDTVIIKTSWSGSAAGIQTVAQNGTPVLTVPFLTVDGGATSGTANVTATTASVPDVAMADNTQGSTPFNGAFLRTTAYTTLTATQVGIVPFVWVKSNPTGLTGLASTRWSALTNITSQLARAQWTNGSGILPLSLYTGAASDSGVNVYAAGRDPDSGTRITAFAESGIGASTVVRQFIPGVTAPDNGLYQPTTINGVPVSLGNSGESSGGSTGLQGKLNLTTLTRIHVSYMSVGDAGGLTAAGSQLSYNGVDYSVANIQNGKYTFWAYENLMYKPTLASDKKTVANSLAAQITALATITLDSMQVGRDGDGGTVSN